MLERGAPVARVRIFKASNIPLLVLIAFVGVIGLVTWLPKVVGPRHADLAIDGIGILLVIALLVPIVRWIYIAQHPERWPLAKKVDKALRRQGFLSAVDGWKAWAGVTVFADLFGNGKDDLSMWTTQQGWIDRTPGFELRLASPGAGGSDVAWAGEPLEVDGRATPFRWKGSGHGEDRLAEWIARTFGTLLLSLPRVSVKAFHTTSGGAAGHKIELSIDCAGSDLPLARVQQAAAGAKALFWGLIEALRAPNPPYPREKPARQDGGDSPVQPSV